MYTENTQLYVLRPPSWLTIVGIAVATTVDSIEAINRLNITPSVITITRWRGIESPYARLAIWREANTVR